MTVLGENPSWREPVVWLMLIGLFIAVPVLAGSLIHAGNGGAVPSDNPRDGKARRPRVATGQLYTVSNSHVVEARSVDAGRRRR